MYMFTNLDMAVDTDMDADMNMDNGPEHIGQYGLSGKVFLLWDCRNIEYFTGELGKLFIIRCWEKNPNFQNQTIICPALLVRQDRKKTCELSLQTRRLQKYVQ
jgi:hypothetical protein